MKLRPAAALLAATTLLGACAHAGAPTTAARPPAGMGARAIANPTALQKHVMFFDANGDARLTLDETKRGLKRLGLGSVSGLGGAVFIHLGLRGASAGGLDLDLTKIHTTKHKSDTGAFDAEGRFVPAAFQKIMGFDANKSGSLSWAELSTMIKANKVDGGGSTASKAEFGLLIKLGADMQEAEGGKQVPAVSEKRLRSVYTGSLFYDIAAEREKRPQPEVTGTLPE